MTLDEMRAKAEAMAQDIFTSDGTHAAPDVNQVLAADREALLDVITEQYKETGTIALAMILDRYGREWNYAKLKGLYPAGYPEQKVWCYYRHAECTELAGIVWTLAAPDIRKDRCIACGLEIEPFKTEDI